jgi:glycerol-3-phosphate dehydrogenase (NAD(P)+)
MQRIAIIGAGAWGTALATVLARPGRQVTIWAHDPAVAASINGDHVNPLFLPGVGLAPAIHATSELSEAGAAEAVVLAVPAQAVRGVIGPLRAILSPRAPLVIAAKGIEIRSGSLMSEVVAEILPGHPIAILSGPTFAAEVARGLPTGVTLAARESALARGLAENFGTRTFRPYASTDPIGAEIGGAVKNVLAIACGIVMGRELGENARAALITRGLAEMVRLGRAKGGNPETLMGLSGLGDLALTCTSLTSRNLSLGLALGKGSSLGAALAGKRTVAEGVATAAALVPLADRLSVEMPIAGAVESILHRGAAIDEAIAGLLARPLTSEHR